MRLRLLLQTGASPLSAHCYGCLPLHLVPGNLSDDAEEAVRRLLEAAPAAAMVAGRQLPLHHAAAATKVPALLALLEAAPEAALVKRRGAVTPLGLAIAAAVDSAAVEDCQDQWHTPLRVFIAGKLLAAMPLAAALEDLASHLRTCRTLFVDLAATSALDAEQWQRFPAPCSGLLRALPAALRRSEAEATLLVARLPCSDRERLQGALRCLHRGRVSACRRRWCGASWHWPWPSRTDSLLTGMHAMMRHIAMLPPG